MGKPHSATAATQAATERRSYNPPPLRVCAPLPPVHGFPLRAIVPGWEGAYSVKWLQTLRVIDREFDGFWVATGYRYPTRTVAPGATVDAKDMAPLMGLAVKTLLTRPLFNSTEATMP